MPWLTWNNLALTLVPGKAGGVDPSIPSSTLSSKPEATGKVQHTQREPKSLLHLPRLRTTQQKLIPKYCFAQIHLSGAPGKTGDVSVASSQFSQHLAVPKWAKTHYWLNFLQAKHNKARKGLSCSKVYKLNTSQTGFSLTENNFPVTSKPADQPCPPKAATHFTANCCPEGAAVTRWRAGTVWATAETLFNSPAACISSHWAILGTAAQPQRGNEKEISWRGALGCGCQPGPTAAEI